MGTPTNPPTQPSRTRWPFAHVLIILGLWLIIFVGAVSTPPLLDDADATHAQAAQAMLSTGDWVTLHVNGIRYLEKPPLPYWIAAASLCLFAPRTAPYGSAAAFAIHFPLALTILGLALLGYAWSRRAFGQRAAFYTALFTLTSAGVFLFTRVFIPDALLSLLLAFALYALLRSLETFPQQHLTPSSETYSQHQSVILSEGTRGSLRAPQSKDPEALVPAHTSEPFRPASPATQTIYPYALWLALALAVLTKGLVSLVFFFGTAIIYLAVTRQLHLWRRLRPFIGILLFLAVAAPWHILAGLRNTGGANGHGFFWFYFINEHVLRFLGRRIPRDYNKLPGYLYWSLHLVWLFPWSLFAPAALIVGWRNRRNIFSRIPSAKNSVPTLDSVILSEGAHRLIVSTAAEEPRRTQSTLNRSTLSHPGSHQLAAAFRHQTILTLLIFCALVLVFFSLSTNQEYYTFPVYLPLLMLLAAALTAIECQPLDPTFRRALTFAFAAYTTIGLAIAAALAYGLWSSRHLPYVRDIGDLLAHRGVGDYTLSMSHFFDLTGPSFAALRAPAALALLAFLIGPPTAWFLHSRRRSAASMLAIAYTSAAFLVAAHIALIRFTPMLSSVNFVTTIQSLERNHSIEPNTEILLFGDQAFGSSIPFYLDRRILLVDGRSTSMLFGSTFPDAPPIFLTPAGLLAQWGHGPRKLLAVPLEQRDTVDQLLGNRQIVLEQTSGKALITDRPLNTPQP